MLVLLYHYFFERAIFIKPMFHVGWCTVLFLLGSVNSLDIIQGQRLKIYNMGERATVERIDKKKMVLRADLMIRKME